MIPITQNSTNDAYIKQDQIAQLREILPNTPEPQIANMVTSLLTRDQVQEFIRMVKTENAGVFQRMMESSAH